MGVEIWIIAGVLLSLAFLFRLVGRRPLEPFNHFAQGMAGVATIAALVTAGVVYFQERRDKARYSFTIAHNAVPLINPAGRADALLVQITLEITNVGSRKAKTECNSIDIFAIEERLGRNPAFHETEYGHRSLLVDKPHGADWPRCWSKLKRQIPGLFQSGSGYIWPAATLEPGELDRFYYEIVVPCRLAAIKTLIKVRRVTDALSNEQKIVFPVNSRCLRASPANPASGEG